MCGLNPTPTGAVDTGADQGLFEKVTCSGSDSVNAPLVSRPGSLTLRVASPAVEITVALVWAGEGAALPRPNAANVGGVPRVSESVAGTDPPTLPGVVDAS